jgi:phage head maturation protease
MYSKMSWAFVVDDNGDSYDAKTRTRNILKVKKVYDCAVVSHAANPATSVQARSAQDYFTGVVKPVLIQELEERQAIEQRNNAIDEYLANIRKAVKK